MDRQDSQDKSQEQGKCSLFRAKVMNPYLCCATVESLIIALELRRDDVALTCVFRD